MPTHQLITPFLVVATLAASAPGLSAGERQQTLQAALKGADRVTLRDVEYGEREKPVKPFESRDAAKIANLVSSLNFDDGESGFHCMCDGDAIVTFYRGDRKLAEISHHHGQSLRWNGGNWKGDSLFTEEAAKAWREWFGAQGEPRFEKMHQLALKEAKREQEIDERFMRAFKPGTAEVFSNSGDDGWNTFSPQGESGPGGGEMSPPAKKLAALYPDRAELATALAKALGSLAVMGASEGSWSVSSSREQLVLECAKALDAEAFRAVLERNDDEVLAGAARLFFFEKLSGLLPQDQRARYAAKLAKVVLERDKCGNADMALRALGSFPCPETVLLLEELARGTLKPAAKRSGNKDEPGCRAAACLMLARWNTRNAAELSKAAANADGNDKIDQAALKIARSFSGERGLLDKSIFEIDSFSVGFGALAALEREADKAALEAIITGGTEHSWAAIREEAVLTVERMTGRKWYQHREQERAEWHGKAIREWWQANRESCKLPEMKTDTRSGQGNS